jgi:hypothetical protein
MLEKLKKLFGKAPPRTTSRLAQLRQSELFPS